LAHFEAKIAKLDTFLFFFSLGSIYMDKKRERERDDKGWGGKKGMK
jgi:hypothetical protein